MMASVVVKKEEKTPERPLALSVSNSGGGEAEDVASVRGQLFTDDDILVYKDKEQCLRVRLFFGNIMYAIYRGDAVWSMVLSPLRLS